MTFGSQMMASVLDLRGGEKRGSAVDAGLSLTPCTSVTVSKPSTEALGGRGEGGTVTRELITENAI